MINLHCKCLVNYLVHYLGNYLVNYLHSAYLRRSQLQASIPLSLCFKESTYFIFQHYLTIYQKDSKKGGGHQVWLVVPQDITRLLVQILPMLDPPERARDAHFRWTLSATSNCLEKRGWVGRCWQGLRNRNRNLQKCNLINITYLVNLVLVCSSVEVHFPFVLSFIAGCFVFRS